MSIGGKKRSKDHCTSKKLILFLLFKSTRLIFYFCVKMGYAKVTQKGTGLHLRQYARAFILDDGNQSVAFVSVDVGMIGYGLRKEVHIKY